MENEMNKLAVLEDSSNSRTQLNENCAAQLAQDCWGGANQQATRELTLASANSNGASNPQWLEERAAQVKRDLAVEFGLDPDKATMDEVIRARAEQGTQKNEGRVERLRVEDARKYGLDPEKADWTQINIARVEARKRELGMEK